MVTFVQDRSIQWMQRLLDVGCSMNEENKARWRKHGKTTCIVGKQSCELMTRIYKQWTTKFKSNVNRNVHKYNPMSVESLMANMSNCYWDARAFCQRIRNRVAHFQQSNFIFSRNKAIAIKKNPPKQHKIPKVSIDTDLYERREREEESKREREVRRQMQLLSNTDNEIINNIWSCLCVRML